MTPGRRKQKARKRRAKKLHLVGAPGTSVYAPPAPPAAGTLVPFSTDGRKRYGLALGGGHVNLEFDTMPPFGVPGYDLRAAYPRLVAALVGGGVRPVWPIEDVLASTVRRAAKRGGKTDPLSSALHVWVVMYRDDVATAQTFGVIVAEENPDHGFGPRAF